MDQKRMQELQDGKEIMQLYHSGDRAKALELMCTLLMPWVKTIAARYKKQQEYDDLVQEGQIAIIEHIDEYDPQTSIPITYFNRIIHGAIYDYVVRQQGVKRHDVTTQRKIKDAMKALEELGEDCTVDNIYRMLDGKISREVITKNQKLFQNSSGVIHLDRPTENNENASILDFYIYEEDTPEKQYEENELKAEVHAAIDTLSEEEKELITDLFFEDMTMTQAEELMGLSQLTAKKLRTAAFLKLKANKRLSEYVGNYQDLDLDFGVVFDDDIPMHFDDVVELEL